MKNKTEVQAFLFKKYIEKVSELTGKLFLELKGTDEQKKSLEAMDFMTQIMQGGKFPDKDLPFIERNKELFQEIQDYVSDINSLGE